MDRLSFRRRGRPLHLAAALWFAAVSLSAQDPEGEIRVQVKDPSGAAMEASGKLESLAPGVSAQLSDRCAGHRILLEVCPTAATGWRFPKPGSPPSPC